MAGTTPETVCTTRTCLTWTADGELSAEDRSLVLERLAHAESEACRSELSTPISS